MELTELYTNAKAKMEKCMTSLERDFSAVRAGRANPAVLDKVMVDYYGVPTPVNQMGRYQRAGGQNVGDPAPGTPPHSRRSKRPSTPLISALTRKMMARLFVWRSPS